MESDNPLWLIVPFLGLGFLWLCIWLSDAADRKQYDADLKSGRIRKISHAEYNRRFGIPNTLKEVDKK